MSILLWILASVIIGGALVITISGVITSEKIKDYLQNENYKYGRIKEIIEETKTISLEAFNQLGEKTDIEFKSDDGYSLDLYEGMKI